MQTFLPYPDDRASAADLDDRRLGKQRVETLQILRALTWRTYGWQNHPAVRMWRGFVPALVANVSDDLPYLWPPAAFPRRPDRRGHADALPVPAAAALLGMERLSEETCAALEEILAGRSTDLATPDREVLTSAGLVAVHEPSCRRGPQQPTSRAANQPSTASRPTRS